MTDEKDGGRLTPKQDAFARAYVVTGDASAAYRSAYDAENMSAKTVNEAASRLLVHGKVAARVAELQQRKVEAAAEKFDITVERVLQELAAIGFANISDYLSKVDGKVADDVPEISLRGVTRDRMRAVAELTIEDIESGKRTGKRVKIKLHDKRAALVDIGRHLGLFSERHEHKIEFTTEAEEFDAKLAAIVARAAEDRARGGGGPSGGLN
jgi:phage terminase small subunit